jgi:hypothetical protein
MRGGGEEMAVWRRRRRLLRVMGLASAVAFGCRASDEGLDAVTPPSSETEPPAPEVEPPPSAGCQSGVVHCAGKVPQTCGADGRWVNQESCGYVCQDGAGCVNRFAAVSSGHGSPTDHEGRAEFAVNTETVFSGQGGLLGAARGFNVALLDPASGRELEPVRNFDPWGSPLTGRALDELADYLAALEPDRLVMIAVSDDAGITALDACGPSDSGPAKRVVDQLQRLGSNMIGAYCFRGAWSFIGLTGENRALAEKLSTGAKVSTEVLLPSAL